MTGLHIQFDRRDDAFVRTIIAGACNVVALRHGRSSDAQIDCILLMVALVQTLRPLRASAQLRPEEIRTKVIARGFVSRPELLASIVPFVEVDRKNILEQKHSSLGKLSADLTCFNAWDIGGARRKCELGGRGDLAER